MVEVFKTNIQQAETAEKLIEMLHEYFPELEINVDLEDRDKVLRLQSLNEKIDLVKLKFLCKSMGCLLEELE